MTTEEQQPPAEAPEGQRANEGQRISVGSGDESVAKLQLAARWAEHYAPRDGDSLRAMLKRFRHVYDYLDAITHGIEPPGEEDAEGGRR